ncbi:hypothetical protein HGI30_17620 [Paenibacillus albicereus]|uniref:Sporulation protein YtxC n=1 Tax=Paenibacillus albicereus TaxID=2726185 RepID=A0A6H2H0N4_9BACL|nr:putative sporulation protein YtxC [Paenibacillus albicereus]QJC53212.1 hypothetical protein HGI30_17620 [Paenibacillus albicereus]
MELLVVELIEKGEDGGAALLLERLNEHAALAASQGSAASEEPLWSWGLAEEAGRLRCTANLPRFRLGEHGGLLYEGAASALSDYIVDRHEGDLVRQIIRKHYRYSREEELAVERCCRLVLSGEQWSAGEEADAPGSGRSLRSSRIAAELRDYFEENASLHLQGYVTFRLHGYWQELRDAAEYAVEEYVMDKQYQEFISLLKYYVASQPSRRSLVHVLHEPERGIRLLDESREPLDIRSEGKALAELVDAELNMEDMVLSSLIAAAPASIRIHTSDPEHQVVRTIRSIFDSRIGICGGCPDCAEERREGLGGGEP